MGSLRRGRNSDSIIKVEEQTLFSQILLLFLVSKVLIDVDGCIFVGDGNEIVVFDENGNGSMWATKNYIRHILKSYEQNSQSFILIPNLYPSPDTILVGYVQNI